MKDLGSETECKLPVSLSQILSFLCEELLLEVIVAKNFPSPRQVAEHSESRIRSPETDFRCFNNLSSHMLQKGLIQENMLRNPYVCQHLQ